MLTGPTLITPVLVTRAAARVGQRTLLITTMILMAAGSAWLTTLHPAMSIAALAGPLITLGIGFGISLAVLDGAAVSSVEPARAGMAAGMFNTVRLTGEAVAIAALGAILSGVIQNRLESAAAASRAHTATGQLLQGNRSGASATLRTLRTSDVSDAYTHAMHIASVTLAGLMLAGVAAVIILIRTDERSDTLGAEKRTS